MPWRIMRHVAQPANGRTIVVPRCHSQRWPSRVHHHPCRLSREEEFGPAILGAVSLIQHMLHVRPQACYQTPKPSKIIAASRNIEQATATHGVSAAFTSATLVIRALPERRFLTQLAPSSTHSCSVGENCLYGDGDFQLLRSPSGRPRSYRAGRNVFLHLCPLQTPIASYSVTTSLPVTQPSFSHFAQSPRQGLYKSDITLLFMYHCPQLPSPQSDLCTIKVQKPFRRCVSVKKFVLTAAA